MSSTGAGSADTAATGPDEAERAGTRGGKGKGLLGAAVGVAGLMLVGNGLGFVRDMVLAALFGAGANTDAFVVGWTVPETFSTLFLEGLLPLVLVPWLVARVTDRDGLRTALGTIAVPVLALGVGVGVLSALASRLIVTLVAPNVADPGLAQQCVLLASFTIPALTIAGTLSAVLRSTDNLVLPAVVYSVYNIGIIGTTVLLHDTMDVRAAALGLSVGAALMCLVQLPKVLSMSGIFPLRRVAAAPVVTAVTIAFPTLGYLVTRQAQVFAERFFGSQLPGGAITYLNFAQKLGQFPVTLALSLALVSFPSLSRYAAEGDDDAVRSLIAKVTKAIGVILVPAMAGVIVASRPVVSVAFGRGNFTADAVGQTAATLSVYAIGLLAQALVTTGALAHFAVVRKTWVPALWAVACLAATVVLDAVLVSRWGTRGVAFGNAAGITLAALGLYASLVRKDYFRMRDVAAPAGRAVAVAAVGGSLAHLVQRLPVSPLLQLLGSLLAFVVGYGVVLVASRGAIVTDITGPRGGAPETLDEAEAEAELAEERDAVTPTPTAPTRTVGTGTARDLVFLDPIEEESRHQAELASVGMSRIGAHRRHSRYHGRHRAG